MTGSLRLFGYTDDGGAQRFCKLDESVAESAALGFTQSVSAAIRGDYGNQVFPSKKRPIEMRYVLCVRNASGGGQAKRRFYVGSTSATAWDADTSSITVDGETWQITAKIGEKRYLSPAADTGLQDGDDDVGLPG